MTDHERREREDFDAAFRRAQTTYPGPRDAWWGWQARAARAPEAAALAEHDREIIEDIRVMSRDYGCGFWPRALAIATLRIMKDHGIDVAAPAASEPTVPAESLSSLRGMAAETLDGRTSEQIVESSRAAQAEPYVWRNGVKVYRSYGDYCDD